MNDNKNNKKFATMLGHILAMVFLTCITICLSGIVVGATIRFLSMIF